MTKGPMATKKSLFSKPKWAAKAASPATDEANNDGLFRHNIYTEVAKAEREKEEKRQAKSRQKEERKRKSESRDTKVDEDEQPVKKQRMSIDPVVLNGEDDDFDKRRSDSDSDSDESEKSVASRRSRRRSSSPPMLREEHTRRDSTRKSGRKSVDLKKEPPHRSTRSRPVDSDDDIAIPAVQPRAKPALSRSKSKPDPPPPPAEEPSSDSEPDEHLRELRRQARAEAQAREAARLSAQNPPPTQPNGALPSLANENGDTIALGPAVPDPSDPIVLIRIISLIPNTQETIVKIQASKPLDNVLNVFITKFAINRHLAPQIFFTWNLVRLYRSTTMQSILTRIERQYDGKKNSENKIELEAMTEDILKHRLEQKERARRGEYDEKEDETAQRAAVVAPTSAATDSPAPTQKERGSGTVIRLKSDDPDDLPDMSLRVHPHTPIEKIVRGYKRKMNIDMGRNLYLVFEGEALEPAQTVEDVGFEEGDAVDVRAR